MTKVLVELITTLREGIASFDRQIAQATAVHPDFVIFDSFPGAGPARAPRLLAAFGAQRDRYQSAAGLQTFSGIAPVTERSGKSEWVHVRWACPRFVRQTFHEWAAHSIVTGPPLTTVSCGIAEKTITPPSGHWLSNGSESPFAAGKTVFPTTTPTMSRISAVVVDR